MLASCSHYDGLAGLGRFTFKHGKEGFTVRSLSGGERGSSEIGQGGEEIGEADGVIDGPGFFDCGGPAHDEGHAVTGFPGVGFHAAQSAGAVVREFLSVDIIPNGSVVRGEHDEGIFCHACFFERGEHLADLGVNHVGEIAVEP